jgi:hypothetical protein
VDAIDGVMVRYRRATGRPLDSRSSTRYVPLALYTTRKKNRAPDEKRIRVGFSKKEENEWGQWGMGEIAHVGCVSPEVGVDGAR